MTPKPTRKPTPIPTAVIAGYLGAGKTTLINHLLRNSEGRRLAVLVNDFGSLNIDADLIESRDGVTYSLTNGCVCCSIGADLDDALHSVLQQVDNIDEVIVEASGVAVPSKVALSVAAWEELALSGVFVVVDLETIDARMQDKFVGQLVKQQLRDADMLIFNKPDLVSASDKSRRIAEIEKFAEQTPHTIVENGQVPLSIVHGCALADLSLPALIPTSITSQNHADEFATASIETARLFNRERLLASLSDFSDRLLRAKGIIAFDDGSWGVLQVVGSRIALETLKSEYKPEPDQEQTTRCVFISHRSCAQDLEYLILQLSE